MNMTRKRIRGLRRHFRRLRHRATAPSELKISSASWLVRFQQTFLTVTADPWASWKAVPRQPEFRALWVQHLLRTFPYWHAQLQRRYPAFYLALELQEPTPEHFFLSRLVVAVNERLHLFGHRWGVAQDLPLPAEYGSVPGIEALDWQAYDQWSRPYTVDEFARESNNLANMRHKAGRTDWGDPCIFVHLGVVWVGQARNQ